MKKQTAAALKCYFSRRLALFFLAVILLVSVVALGFIFTRGNDTVDSAPTVYSYQNFNSPLSFFEKFLSTISNQEFIYSEESWQKHLQQTPIDEIRALSVVTGTEPLPFSMKDLTKLEFLSWRVHNFSEEQLATLIPPASLHSLELSVHDPSKISRGMLKTVGEHLQRLELDSQSLLAFADELPELKKVRFLRVEGSDLTLELTQAAASLPALETLVVNSGESPNYAYVSESTNSNRSASRKAESEQILAPLNSHAHLRFVYTNWGHPSQPDRADLKTAWGIQMGYSNELANSHIAGVYLVVVLTIWILIQQRSVLMRPASLVTPGYLTAHRNAAMLLNGISVAICVLILWCGGNALLPALAIILLSSLLAATTISVIYGTSFGLILVYPLAIFMMAQSWLGIFLGEKMYDFQAAYYYFQTGHLPGFTLLLVLGGLVLFFWQYSRPETWPRFLNEKFSVIPETVLQSLDAPSVKREQKKRRDEYIGLPEKYQGYHQRSFWRQVILTEKGTIPPNSLLLWMALFCMVVMLNFWEQVKGFGDSEFFVKLTPYLWMLFYMNAFFVIAGWANEKDQPARQLLMPTSRQNFVRHHFAGLMWSLLKITPFALAAFGIWLYTRSLEDPNFGFQEMCLVVPMFVGGVCWLLSTGILIFAIRSEILRGAWGLLVLPLPLVSATLIWLIMTGLIGYPEDFYQKDLSWFTLYGGILILVSGAMLRYSYFRALEREWG